MKKFTPQSPDPYLNEGTDMGLAKFGHLNALKASVSENVFADNATAITGGLTPGDLYSTVTGEVRVVV